MGSASKDDTNQRYLHTYQNGIQMKSNYSSDKFACEMTNESEA